MKIANSVVYGENIITEVLTGVEDIETKIKLYRTLIKDNTGSFKQFYTHMLKSILLEEEVIKTLKRAINMNDSDKFDTTSLTYILAIRYKISLSEAMEHLFDVKDLIPNNSFLVQSNQLMRDTQNNNTIILMLKNNLRVCWRKAKIAIDE